MAAPPPPADANGPQPVPVQSLMPRINAMIAQLRAHHEGIEAAPSGTVALHFNSWQVELVVSRRCGAQKVSPPPAGSAPRSPVRL
jgi:hypothetical protein